MYTYVKQDDTNVWNLDVYVHFHCAGIRSWLGRNVWTRS